MVYVIYSIHASRGDEQEEILGVAKTRKDGLDFAWKKFQEHFTPINEDDDIRIESRKDAAMTEGFSVVGYASDDTFFYCRPTTFVKPKKSKKKG